MKIYRGWSGNIATWLVFYPCSVGVTAMKTGDIELAQ